MSYKSIIEKILRYLPFYPAKKKGQITNATLVQKIAEFVFGDNLDAELLRFNNF